VIMVLQNCQNQIQEFLAQHSIMYLHHNSVTSHVSLSVSRSTITCTICCLLALLHTILYQAGVNHLMFLYPETLKTY